jgi:hypothetical protein
LALDFLALRCFEWVIAGIRRVPCKTRVLHLTPGSAKASNGKVLQRSKIFIAGP